MKITRSEYREMVDDLLSCQTTTHHDRCTGGCRCDEEADTYERWLSEIESQLFDDTPSNGT